MKDLAGLTKDQIRAEAMAYRLRLKASTLGQMSLAMARSFADLPETRKAETIHVYIAIRERAEIDTSPLISALRASRKRIILPVVRNFERPLDGLSHHEWHENTALSVNRWGISEPVGGPTVPLSEIDMVIVPALAADIDGYRVGYGKGYYDAFLGEVSATSVGLVPEEWCVHRVPHESHDVPLDIVITENGVVRCARNTDRQMS